MKRQAIIQTIRRQPSTFRLRRARTWSAFTLIELLVVIALSGLLLALLFAPIIQGFRITNRTKALVQAQDATRYGLENMEREISEAAYVFDNTNTTINLPLEPSGTYPKRTQNGTALYSASTLQFTYGRLDLIPVDLNGGSSTAIDPTTGTPVGGAGTRVPGAPSTTRYVRYFVALQNPVTPAGAANYYANVYLFPHSGIDNTLNPFILYRVQYNPYDANLITQTNGQPSMSNTADGGGFGDPDFFYGGPHAAAWRALASPVVSGTNLDMLLWQRNSNGQFDTGAPLRLATTFAPATVVGDTATPGFLSNENADALGAVPTLYTAQKGQWTLPFTVHVFRGVGTSASGSLSLGFAFPSGMSGNSNLAITVNGSGAYSGVTANSVYCFYSPNTGRYFVTVPGKTIGLAFWIDPARGRIETGLPPVSASNGAPYVYAYKSDGTLDTVTTPAPLAAAGVVNSPFELAPTVYRETTLDSTNANQGIMDPTTATTLYVPANQGILFADLRAQAAPATAMYAGYYLATTLPMAISSSGTTLASPFVSFDGAILAPGTEKVVGPDNNITTSPRYGTLAAQLFNYYRVGNTNDGSGTNTQPSKSTTGQQYNRSGSLNYSIDPNYKFTSAPKLDFGIAQMDYTLPTTGSPATAYQTFLIKNGYAGLPAQPAGMSPTTTSTAQSLAELQVSFLWQNNFARDQNGFPMSADGTIANAANGGAVTPQPDVFRLDYATRSLLNLSLGASVYDSSGGAPQTAQISDKVKINNVGQ